MTTAATSSSFSSSDSKSSPSVEIESSTLTPDERCAYYAPDEQGCARPRDCQNCLIKSGCGINSNGDCVNQSELAMYIGKNYREAFDADLVLPNATKTNTAGLNKEQDWRFPSLEVRYCRADDAVCTRCISERFYTSQTAADSRFCVGADGCVCIMNCEFPLPADKCATIETPTPAPSSSDSIPSSSGQEPGQLAYYIVGPICLGFLLWLAYKCRRVDDPVATSRRDQPQVARTAEREQARQHRLDTRGVGLISLAGWNQQRKQAIENEHATFTSVTYAPAPATPPSAEQRDAAPDSHV